MKILNHFLKDIQVSTSKGGAKVESNPMAGNKNANDLGLAVETVTEDDMIKEVFEAEKVEMTQKT